MKKRRLRMFIISLMALIFTMPLSAMDFQYKLEADNMEFLWTVEGDQIHVQLSAKTSGWVGIGFDPEKAMSGANIIIGAVKNGKFRIEDHYADRKTSHKNDEKLGGTNNVLNPSGKEIDGITTISFTFPLDTGDKYDKPIIPGKFSKVMLAYGGGKDSFKTRHPYRAVYEINLSTGENRKIK